MNVTPRKTEQTKVVKDLRESYKRCHNLREFLLENGDSINTRSKWSEMALNESVTDKSKHFTFENGMYIPSLESPMKNKYSLLGICESSANFQEFAQNVTKLCENMLEFTPTDTDIKNLQEHYSKHIVKRL